MAQDILDFKVNIETQNAATAMENLGNQYESLKGKMERNKIKIQIDGISEIKSSIKEVNSLLNNIGKTSGKGTKIDLSKMFSLDQASFGKQMQQYFDKAIKDVKAKTKSSSSKDDALLAKLLVAEKASSYPYANEVNEKFQKQLSAYSRQNVTGKNLEYIDDAYGKMSKIESLQQKISKGISNGNSIENIVSDYEQLVSVTQELTSIMNILGTTMEKSLDVSVIDNALAKVEKYRDGLKNITDEQNVLLSKVENKYNKEGLTRSEKVEADRYFNEVKNQISQQQKIASIQQEAMSGKYSLNYAKADTLLSKYEGQDSGALAKARAAVQEYKKLSEEVTSLAKKKNDGEIIDDAKFAKSAENLVQSGERMKNALEEVRVAESRTLKGDVASTAANNVQKYINDNTKAWKKYKTQLEAVREEYRNAVTEGDKATADLKFKNIKSSISAEGLTGKGFFDDFKRAIGQVSQFTGAYAIAQNVLQEVPRKIFTAVKDVNAAQIELRKVSDASDGQLVEYWDQAAESAKKYGATVSDVISSTADWSRLGYSLDEAKQLSDMTTLLHKVGDNMTQESSSEGLISTLRGFKMQASEAQKIVDVANQVANTEPIDTAGIFEAMQRSASSLSAAGNTYEQSVALATAANSVVQDSQKIGTALKTISMRIRGAETEMQQEGLDTEGMATSTAKLRKEVLALSGVDVMKNANEFKSTYDILDELSNKWSELTDIQQASVTELIAGELDFASIYRNINKRTYLIARAA